MADLMKKASQVNICVRKDIDFDIEKYDDDIKSWLNENCENYAYIYHREDINLEGRKESKHIHIVCILKYRKRLLTILYSFTSFLHITTTGVMIDKCNSFEGSIQYLIHKNDINKTPHKISEIVSSFSEDDLNNLMGADCKSLTAQRLFNIVAKAETNYEIINALGLGVYRLYRPLINDIKEDLHWKGRGLKK